MAEEKKLTATQKKAAEKKALAEKEAADKAATLSEEVNENEVPEVKIMSADAPGTKEITTMKTFKLNTTEANFTSVGRQFVSLTNPYIDIEDEVLIKQAEELVRAGKLVEVKP